FDLSIFFIGVTCCRLLVLFLLSIYFFLNDPPTTEIYTLSLHDALPIWRTQSSGTKSAAAIAPRVAFLEPLTATAPCRRWPPSMSRVLALRCAMAKETGVGSRQGQAVV